MTDQAMRRRRVGVWLLLAMSLPALAAKPKPEPIVASSASFGGYAVAFPSELDAAMAAFTEHRAELTTLVERFSADRDALKDPRALALVTDLVDSADESGHAYAYVDRAHQLDGVSAFLDTEANDVSRRIATANESTARESSCSLDLYSSTSGALKSGVGKQQQEQIRASNEAFFLIERHRDPLTRADVTALMKLADDVARASFLANIELVEEKVRLRRLVSESERVKRALEVVIEAEAAYQVEAGRTETEKKSSNARIEAASVSRDRVDESVAAVTVADTEGALDATILAAQRAYEASLRLLGE